MKERHKAGVDQIEHFNFLLLDGSRKFSQKTADMIAKKDLIVSPTIQTGYRAIESLENKKDISGLSPSEENQLKAAKYKLDTKLEYTNRFREMGVKIVMGTDAIREFGDYAIGLKLLSKAGLSQMELIRSATSVAAKAIGVNDIGELLPGMKADMIYLDGNPLSDINSFDRVMAVVLNGELVVDKKFDHILSSPILGKDMAMFIL